MAARFFGQYLLERGLITREGLLDALEYQKRINLPLGALAIEKKYLTPEQVRNIHAEQQRTDKKFGEIAVEKKLLTKAQLDNILKSQAERWVFLGEALVAKNHLSHEQLDQELRAYRKEQEKDKAVIEADLGTLPHREVVEDFLDISIKLFLRIAREVVKVTAVETGTLDATVPEYCFTQKVHGDKNFYYALFLPQTLVLPIASQMIQKDQEEVNDFVLDAVSEFVNIVVGNGCSKVNMREYRVEPEPPQTIQKGESTPFPLDAIIAQMASTQGNFQIAFVFSD